MAYRNYSDEDKAVAMAYYDACGNYKMAARECNVPLQSLRDWVSNRDNMPDEVTESVTEKKTDLADKLEALAHSIVDAAPGKIGDAPLAASLTALGIAVDKMRLLREQSTTITEKAHPKSIEERDAMALELLEKVKLRMVG